MRSTFLSQGPVSQPLPATAKVPGGVVRRRPGAGRVRQGMRLPFTTLPSCGQYRFCKVKFRWVAQLVLSQLSLGSASMPWEMKCTEPSAKAKPTTPECRLDHSSRTAYGQTLMLVGGGNGPANRYGTFSPRPG